MINIIYEDEYYIVANKPAWWLTHPSDEARHVKENVLTVLRDHANTFVFPVNRLDRQVSGLIVFAKNQAYVTRLQSIWHTDQVEKEYTALAHGQLEEAGEFKFALKGKRDLFVEAHTLYAPLEVFEDSTLVKVKIFTGRRHQIRRHFARRMHALLGDRMHGKKVWNDKYMQNFGLSRIFLHSSRLKFYHPYLEKDIELHCPLEQDLQIVLDKMRNDKKNIANNL